MNETMTAVVEGIVVILAIVMGVRAGGIGLGLWGMAGTTVLVFGFQDVPGEPPIGAFFIIIAVITASSAMQAAGGIDWLVDVAARVIKRHPNQITYVAPLVTFLFTMGAGTGNLYLSLIPVIYSTSYQAKVRPERPLATSTIASGFGLTASPVAAAMAALIGLVEVEGFTLGKILAITIPAGLFATVVASWVMSRRGKEMLDDPEYQRRLQEGLVTPPAENDSVELKSGARRSALIFLGGVGFIVLAGLFEELRPTFVEWPGTKGETLAMTPTIVLVMATVALLIMVANRVPPADIAHAPLMNSGVVAGIALLGLAWLTATYLDANPIVVDSIADLVTWQPVLFAAALFLVAALTTSQSGATKTIVPIGLTAGLSAATIVGMWPSLVGVFLLPANGTQLACVEIDQTGSTKLSKNPLYHSFTVPLFVGWAASLVAGLLIAQVL